jgi:type I restriction enzyme S subunit
MDGVSMIADYPNDEIYSQNRIDDLADNWQVQPIIKLCKRIVDYRGKTPQFSNSGIIHLRSSNVKNGSLVLNGVTYVSEETYKAFMTRGFPKAGDVIFTTEGPLGEAALVPDNFTFSLAQRMIVLQVDENILDSTYLMYALYSRRVRNDYFGRATGATVKGISSKTFQKVRIPFPPPLEQRAIAHTLRTIQKAKEARQRELELERERKAALMQYLFTHGTGNEPRKKTELGDIPQSWQVVKLGKVCKFLQYGTSKKCDLDSSGLPVLRIPNVIGGKVNTGDLKFVKLSSNEAESLMLKLGDLLFVRTNGRREYTGRCAVFSGEPQEALFASYLIRARLDTEN